MFNLSRSKKKKEQYRSGIWRDFGCGSSKSNKISSQFNNINRRKLCFKENILKEKAYIL